MEGSQNIDFQFKTDGLTNTNQLPENGDDLKLYDLEGASNAKRGADPSFGMDGNVGLPELHESRDPEPTKRKGRYNLRKSLAWDSAFFTSAGVLDPEELSTMITGTDEAEKHLLPRIEEDINGSTESISSLQSDNLTLDSHEDDLFVDIRASIQRSSKKTSIFTNSNCKKPDTEVDNQAISSLEKEDLAPQCKNPKLAIKKTSGLQAFRTLKGQPNQNTGKPRSGAPLKQDYVQSQNTQVNSISKAGSSTPVLPKPPKSIAKTIPNSTSTVKRDTMGAVAKPGCRSLKPAMASRKGTQPPKVPVATSDGRVFSKPAVSSKSSLASSTSSMVQSSRLSTSSDSSSISSSSKAPAKSLMAKRNPVKTSNVVTGPSVSVTKSTSRAAVKIRPAPSSKISAHMKSTKTSTSVSPASSISEWSSVSSSSSSMVNPRSNNSRTSLDASSRKSTDSNVTLPDRKNQFGNQIVDGHKNKEIPLPGNNLKKVSTGSLQAPTRPSGLRLPSPKIGFFDGANNSRTPNKAPQSQCGSRNVLSKGEAAACTPNRSSNIKTKSSNIPTAKTVTALVNAKSASSKGTPLASAKEKSLASENDALVLTDKDDAPIMSMETKDKATGQNYHKADEVEVGARNQVIDAVMSAISKNLGDLKKEIVMENSHASENDALVVMDIKDAPPSLSLETIDNATGQNYHKANDVEVAAGNQVIDAVMSAINKNLGDLKKEIVMENSHASENDAIVVTDIKDAPSLSLETNDNATGQNYHKVDDVEVAEGNQVIDAVMSAIYKNLGDLKKEMEQNNMEFGVVNIDQGGSGDAMVSQNNLENNFYQISEGSDKENGHVINQGDGVKLNDSNVDISASGPMHEVLSDILDCVVSFPAKASPLRSPFAEKNFTSNEECISISKLSETQVEDMRGSALLSIEKNESC